MAEVSNIGPDGRRQPDRGTRAALMMLAQYEDSNGVRSLSAADDPEQLFRFITGVSSALGSAMADHGLDDGIANDAVDAISFLASLGSLAVGQRP